MSSETAGLTVATQKRNNSVQYWAFFTKEDSAFWNFVDCSREGLKPQGSPSQPSEQPQQMPHSTRLSGGALQSLTAGLLPLPHHKAQHAEHGADRVPGCTDVPNLAETPVDSLGMIEPLHHT
jgi:hypothetical protein